MAPARSFPAINVGSTADTFEVHAFAPGIDASGIEVTLYKGLLTLAGPRKGAAPKEGDKYVGRVIGPRAQQRQLSPGAEDREAAAAPHRGAGGLSCGPAPALSFSFVHAETLSAS